MTKQLTDNITAVEVPIEATNPIIDDQDLLFQVVRKDGISIGSYPLPPGQWEIVGTVTDGVPDDTIIFVATELFLEHLCRLLQKNSCHTGKWVIITNENE